jgi:hypothetical protein
VITFCWLVAGFRNNETRVFILGECVSWREFGIFLLVLFF